MHAPSPPSQDKPEEQPQLPLENQVVVATTSTVETSIIPSNTVGARLRVARFSLLDSESSSRTFINGSADSSDSDDSCTDTSAAGPIVVEETASEASLLQVQVSSATTTNTNTTTTTPRHPQHPIGVAFVVNSLFGFITLVMNAAITIFGMGIGVGLILGDSFRHDTPNDNRSANNMAGGEASEATTTTTTSVVVTHHARASSSSSSSSSTVPSYRVVRREIRVQPPPNLSLLAATTMPAQ
jgi:hypothetical protein